MADYIANRPLTWAAPDEAPADFDALKRRASELAEEARRLKRELQAYIQPMLPAVSIFELEIPGGLGIDWSAVTYLAGLGDDTCLLLLRAREAGRAEAAGVGMSSGPVVLA